MQEKIKIPKYINKIDMRKLVPFVLRQKKNVIPSFDIEKCPFCKIGKKIVEKQAYKCQECNANMDCMAFLMCFCSYTLKQALGRLRFDKDIWS